MLDRLSAVALVSLLIVCSFGCIPPEDYKIRAKQTVENTPPSQRVTLDTDLANQMVLDYQNGKHRQHLKKVVEIEGVVRGIVSETKSGRKSTTHKNEIQLTMPEYAALTITCIFDKNQAAYVQSLKLDDKIAIRGQISDMEATSLTLVGCIPAELTPSEETP